jgi:Fe(3+) dicitrate transport protein
MKNIRFLPIWIIFLLCFFQLPTAAFSQSVSIRGQVSTAAKGKPVAGAEVFIQGTAISASTNAQGWYELSGLPAGKYTLAVFSLGLKSQLKEVEAAAGQRLEVHFSLEELETLLNELTVTDLKQQTSGITRLKAVEGTAIYEAKKSEVIIMDDITANLATNNSRQIYSKVPGLNIWESDGAGLQLGIGGRGLSPNRTSNFNTRQNGYDISADALGYPENYYTPPAEAIEKIQLVRGAASLQYGTQFGGMLNFVMKKGPYDSPLELTTRQTIGSFGLFNSYNSIGGTTGKLNYYTSYQRKQGNGWRPNAGFEVNNFFVDLNFQLSEKFFICFEYTHMNYMAQQPGGLTDTQFQQDPRQSNRARNWFGVNWNLGAVLMEYKFNDRTRLEMKNFGLLAGRDALGELGRINRADPMTERLLIRDNFENLGNETRLMHHYTIKDQPAVFLTGMRYYRGLTHKKQGAASKGAGPDFRFLNADSLYSSHRFPNHNLAFFAENIFPLSEKLSITPGIRYEWISTLSDGYFQKIVYVQDEAGLPVESRLTELDQMERTRPVWLAGIGLSFKAHANAEFYANISQNYRAINFTDLRVMNENMYVDPNLKDESGYSADMGWRGQNSWLNYDVSLFYLKYNDKISLISENRNGIFTRARRNISDAHIGGVESFVEGDLMQLLQKRPGFRLGLFVNLALIEGRYFNSEQSAFHMKKVELVPPVNLKTGLNFRKNNFSASWQWSYMGKQYTDATNTSEIISSAVIGTIPAFQVMDLSLQYRLKQFMFEGGINNLSDQRYFTRRADGYPGPGIIPSDARNFYLTVGYKFSKK